MLLAVVVGGLLGALVAVPVRPARAGDTTPYSSSAATRYQVTFAARSCGSYAEVAVGRARGDVGEMLSRGDAGETLSRPGRDSPYRAGQPVDPSVEDGIDSGCADLPGWRFTLGSAHERKGRYSTVTGRPFTTPPTRDWTPRLDPTGRDTGGLLAGGVTVALSDEQIALAARRQLWVQGGTPDRPVGDGSGFGALRCAVDGRTAGNLQWLSFPSGVRHVFCYAYYVKGAAAGGTVTVRMRTTRPVGYPQPVPFVSGLTNATDGQFSLAGSGEPVEASFTRPPASYQVTPRVPAGWRVAGVTCGASRSDGRSAASRSSVDAATATASVALAAGDTVLCTYSMEPPALPRGLSLKLFGAGAGGAFGLAVVGGSTRQNLTATTDADGTAVSASGADLTALPPGRYTVTVTPPPAQAPQWTVAGALCNGATVGVDAMTVKVDLVAGVGLECVLRLARKAPALRLAVVTADGVAGAAFAVVPVDSVGGGWWAAANTTGYGVPAAAAGDVPRDPGFGGYLLTAVPPRSTLTTAWRLASLSCDSAAEAVADGTVRVSLTPGGPEPTCTASYRPEPTTRLRVTLRATGARSGRQEPAVVEVSCADGSGGRVVLDPAADGPANLPEPLAFLEPTDCVVSQPATGAARTSTVKASALREPASGGEPSELPSPVGVTRDVPEYGVTVTDEFSAPLAVVAGSTYLEEIRGLLPIILVGSGVFVLGGIILIGVLLRRRSV
ncbi:hypothetical protein Pme01_07490 [Planosporangium mesophilum]|uniref:SpaA-like prealbumin fold domain-containing protein n=2 Tax=Planosporangium mesophilum TaxID=689768 RepID=A0A8J3T8C8_9ACTN|nr:hypothetical protein Pme01_07490 [Planosporangium mesophilum]